MWMDGWIVGQIYAPPSQEIWLVPKKIIYWDFMESEKGHQNSQQQESLIAHNLYLGKVRCLVFFGSHLSKSCINFQKIWVVCKALEIIFQMQFSPNFYLDF